jgi:aquaporin Z
MTRKLLTEVIGTFFLVLTVGLTVVAGLPLAPLAIGSALMVMVYMGGAVSGAHYNPAVTLAVLLRRRIGAGEAGAYMVAQLAGAVLAALVVLGVTGVTFVPTPAPGTPAAITVLVEALFTFALCLVVLNVATVDETSANSYFGLAIGFTVMVGAFAGGPISGGAFNPAVGLGPALVTAIFGGTGAGNAIWYIIGPGIGGAAAAGVFAVQHPGALRPPMDAPSRDLRHEPAGAAD